VALERAGLDPSTSLSTRFRRMRSSLITQLPPALVISERHLQHLSPSRSVAWLSSRDLSGGLK
jgi:hypothetical protein